MRYENSLQVCAALRPVVLLAACDGRSQQQQQPADGNSV